jgi:hypothetical protein
MTARNCASQDISSALKPTLASSQMIAAKLKLQEMSGAHQVLPLLKNAFQNAVKKTKSSAMTPALR